MSFRLGQAWPLRKALMFGVIAAEALEEIAPTPCPVAKRRASACGLRSVSGDGDQTRDVPYVFRQHDAKRAPMCPGCIDALRSLSDKEIPRLVIAQSCPGLCRFIGTWRSAGRVTALAMASASAASAHVSAAERLAAGRGVWCCVTDGCRAGRAAPGQKSAKAPPDYSSLFVSFAPRFASRQAAAWGSSRRFAWVDRHSRWPFPG